MISFVLRIVAHRGSHVVLLCAADMKVKELAGLHTVPGNHTVTQVICLPLQACWFKHTLVGKFESYSNWTWGLPHQCKTELL